MSFYKKAPMKKIFSQCLGTACLIGLSITYAQAQTAPWPNKLIRIVVPFAPGSFTDTAARVVGNEIAIRTGQTVIVENKGGAGSTLGTDQVAKSSPDGYTFLVSDNSFAVSSALYEKLPYSPSKDLAPVSLLAESPAILVGRPNLPQKNLKELVHYASSHSGMVSFGSGGIGSSAHLALAGFLNQNNLKLNHIPFKGIAAAVIDVAADRVDVAIGSVGSTVGYVKDGRINGLAISGATRHPLLPNVPTFAEAGFPNYKMMYWFGMLTAAGTPESIISQMQKEIELALATQKVKDVFNAAGVRPVSTSPAQFSKLIQTEIMMWDDIIKKDNIKANLN